MESILIIAVLAVAGVVFQSVVLFRLHERATSSVRQDYLDVLLTQSKTFENALQAVHDTQSVGGTPLKLAVAQHEGHIALTQRAAEQNYELAKVEVEARQRVVKLGRPVAVPASVAHGD